MGKESMIEISVGFTNKEINNYMELFCKEAAIEHIDRINNKKN